jgi:E3 ubiquitin-protein ligase RNF5
VERKSDHVCVMATAREEPDVSNANDGDNDNSGDRDTSGDSTLFECNICLDTARDAVISMCGHLFW